MKSQRKFSFYIIGGGRAGASLAYFLLKQGHSIVSLVERNPVRYQFLNEELDWSFVEKKLNKPKMLSADIILLTVQDDQIAPLVGRLANMKLVWDNKICVHCSGVLPSSILLPLKKLGAAVASIHPIYSFFSDPRENQYFNLAGISLEGEKKVLDGLENIFGTTTNKIFRVDDKEKKAIHLASVFYANFYVALASQCIQILESLGLQEKQIFEVLNPLLLSSIEQVTEFGPRNALTGPVKRGDIETLKSHLAFLKKNHPALLKNYIIMSEQLLKVSSLSKTDQDRISEMFKKYQS